MRYAVELIFHYNEVDERLQNLHRLLPGVADVEEPTEEKEKPSELDTYDWGVDDMRRQRAAMEKKLDGTVLDAKVYDEFEVVKPKRPLFDAFTPVHVRKGIMQITKFDRLAAQEMDTDARFPYPEEEIDEARKYDGGHSYESLSDSYPADVHEYIAIKSSATSADAKELEETHHYAIRAHVAGHLAHSYETTGAPAAEGHAYETAPPAAAGHAYETSDAPGHAYDTTPKHASEAPAAAAAPEAAAENAATPPAKPARRASSETISAFPRRDVTPAHFGHAAEAKAKKGSKGNKGS
ncbi:hypothetical protein M885DRAFT_303626 [Pelagophyceae sp. CCMP2097]|nr:hypothetical protein M885DRAFT_303626 [Pelagophyceae sp. CCMP2097]